MQEQEILKHIFIAVRFLNFFLFSRLFSYLAIHNCFTFFLEFSSSFANAIALFLCQCVEFSHIFYCLLFDITHDFPAYMTEILQFHCPGDRQVLFGSHDNSLHSQALLTEVPIHFTHLMVHPISHLPPQTVRKPIMIICPSPLQFCLRRIYQFCIVIIHHFCLYIVSILGLNFKHVKFSDGLP